MSIRENLDLDSILDLGWETARRVWKLLSPEQRDVYDLAEIREIGQELDLLAFELRQRSHDKAARLAYSVAFVVNNLAEESFPFDQNLADKTSQVLTILTESLLQLECERDATTTDPAELADILKGEWGKLVYPEIHSNSKMPKPHFHANWDGSRPPTKSVLQVLTGISDQLVDATESLSARVCQLADFPYAPAMTRVQHLAKSLRQRIAGSPHLLEAVDKRATERVINTPSLVEDESTAPSQQASGEHLVDQPQSIDVLVIDRSPFFRMLLTSAIEARGYSIHTLATLEEAEAISNEFTCSVIACGEPEAFGGIERLYASKLTVMNREAKIFVMGASESHPPKSESPCHVVGRTDLANLLSLVADALAPSPQESRKIA